MLTENDMKVFSIRIPATLSDQIDARKKLHHRSRNAEIQLLLEMALDIAVARDLKLAKEHSSQLTE